jgi:hypothetical protein
MSGAGLPEDGTPAEPDPAWVRPMGDRLWGQQGSGLGCAEGFRDELAGPRHRTGGGRGDDCVEVSRGGQYMSKGPSTGRGTPKK